MYIKHIKEFFNIKNNFLHILLFSSTHSTLIAGIFVGYFNDIQIKSDKIALLFLISRLTRIIFDLPCGILFEKIGAKKLFFISRILNINYLMLMLYGNSYYVLVLAFISSGIAESCLYGKSETYFFNYKIENHSNLHYQKLLSIYYFATDLMLSLIVFLGTKIYKYFSFKATLKISILYSVLSLFFLLKFKDITFDKKNYQKAKIKDIFQNLFKDDKKVLINGLMLALLNAFIWETKELIPIIFAEMDIDTYKIGIFSSIVSIALTIGSSLPLFFHHKTSKKWFLLVPINGLFFIIFSYLNLEYLLLLTMILSFLFYTSIEIKFISDIDQDSSKKDRSIRMSFFTMTEAIIKIISIGIFSIICKYYNYKIAFFFFLLIYILSSISLVIISYEKRFRNSKKVN